jgi:hypothetical protein
MPPAAPERGRKPTDEVDAGGGERRRGRPPQHDQLMGYVEGIELWHDDADKAYATFLVGRHHEHPSGHRNSGIG